MKALVTAIASVSLLASQVALASEMRIGVVNITQAFNESKFVQSANKKLQKNVKDMETKVQDQQKKLQEMAGKYDAMKAASSAKTKLQAQIIEEQKKLNQMTQEFQNKIREEQNIGMQEFTKLVQTAAIKVAKDKKLNAVLSSAAIVYMDESWIDVTKDIEAAM